MNQVKTVSPKTPEAIESWVSERIEQNKPFAIRGNNTRLAWNRLQSDYSQGGFPQGEHSQINDDVLSTKKIQELLFFDPDDMVVGVQAGMQVSKLQTLLGEKGMFLPINPWYPKSTIGSVFACNDFGPNRMNTGGIRDYIIGIEYVNGKGELVKAGGSVVKNVTGYDLGKMMLGSLGGLGVVTSINFKILPNLVEPQILYCRFDSSKEQPPIWIKSVKAFHEQMIPLDWIEAILSEKGWILGLGFSGSTARRARIENDLRNVLSDNTKERFTKEYPIELLSDITLHKKRALYPGKDRFTGFIPSIIKKLRKAAPSLSTPDYLHVHCMIPTKQMLTNMEWQVLINMGVHLIVHPIGGDCHVIFDNDELKAQQKVIDQLKIQLQSVSGKMTLIQSHSELTAKALGDFVLPNGYSLVKRLKKQLDPSSIFISPFYDF